MLIRFLKYASMIINLRSILLDVRAKKIDILTARQNELKQICEPPLITMNTKNLIPFNGSILIDMVNVGRFVCLKDNGDVGLYVRLIGIEKSLKLFISNSTMLHLQPISIKCSITLWQSRDTTEVIIIIRHGVSLVVKKEYFRHVKRLEIRLETVYKPSFHNGNKFSCTWAVRETWGSHVVVKEMQEVIERRNIIIPVSNIRPSAIEAKIGQPIQCLYDGSETDQISWYQVSSPIPHHVIEGKHMDVLRILEVGIYEIKCEVNSTEEFGGAWKGEIKISRQDFNDSSLPLSYLFIKYGHHALLKSRFCNSELDVYWINQSQEVSKVIKEVDESDAGMYGCLIGSEIMALLRLVVIKRELNLSTPSKSYIELDVVDLTCSISAIFKYGRVTNNLELFLSDGISLAKNSKSVEEDDLDIKLWYVTRARLKDSEEVYVCRWTVVELLGGEDVYSEVVAVEYSYRVEESPPSSSSISSSTTSSSSSSSSTTHSTSSTNPTFTTTSPPNSDSSKFSSPSSSSSSSSSLPSTTSSSSSQAVPIKSSNIRPNTTITHKGSIVFCSNLNRPKDFCTWNFVGDRDTGTPVFTGLGPNLTVHSEGNFLFQCDCMSKDEVVGGSKPWTGVIEVLSKDPIKGIDVKKAGLMFVSSHVGDLTAEFMVELFSLMIIESSF